MGKKYKVTFEYRGKVSIVVNADNEAEAEKLALPEADQLIEANLCVYDCNITEKP
jgi:hypothetical protein